jgi:hypothetical protein
LFSIHPLWYYLHTHAPPKVLFVLQGFKAWYERLLHAEERDWKVDNLGLSEAICQGAYPHWKDIEKPNQPTQVMPNINVILKSTLARGDTFNGKRKYRKHILIMNHHQIPWHKPIIFTLEDGKGVTYPYEDVIVIFMILANHRVHRVLVDNENSINILSKDVMF